MTIAVLGAGSWGLALAKLFAKVDSVVVWGRNCQRMAALSSNRYCTDYLPRDITFDASISFTGDLVDALVPDTSLIILAVPVNGLRELLLQLGDIRDKRDKPLADLIWVCKGFELGSGKLPAQIIAEVLGNITCGALLGPSFALEAAQAQPTVVALSSIDHDFVAKWIKLFQPIDSLRVYANADVIGVQVGAGAKNIFAIAAGIADGLGLGYNARAALITRALAELGRLIIALGGKADTVYGLSGVGDLILTCTGDLSRNRQVGIELARGKPLLQILDELGHVAEGVYATKEVYNLSCKLKIDMPLTHAVYAALYTQRDIREIIGELFAREPKVEG